MKTGSNSNSQKVNDIVDVVHENFKLKLFFGNNDDDDDDDDDDVQIDHVSSSASPLSMKIIICSLAVISATLGLHHRNTTTIILLLYFSTNMLNTRNTVVVRIGLDRIGLDVSHNK